MGHNAIVGQSGGPTTVINSSLAGVFSVCRATGSMPTTAPHASATGTTAPSFRRSAQLRGRYSRMRMVPPRLVSSAVYTMPPESWPSARPTRKRSRYTRLPGSIWICGTAARASLPQCGQMLSPFRS